MNTQNQDKKGGWTKIIVSIVSFLAIIAFVWRVIHETKKQKKFEAEQQAEAKELGVEEPNNEVREEVPPTQSDNFPLDAFKAMLYSSNPIVDDEALNPENGWSAENAVHVFQRGNRDINTRKGPLTGCFNRRFLEVVIELPNYVENIEEAKKNRSSFKQLDIVHYKHGFKALQEKIEDILIVKDGNKTFKVCPFSSRLAGYLLALVQWEKNGEEREIATAMSDRCYQAYDQERHGLTDLYKQAVLTNSFGDAEEDVKSFINYRFSGAHNVSATKMYLGYRMQFPLADAQNPRGITLKKFMEIMDFILNEFEISAPGVKQTVMYDNVIFHAPEEDGNWSWEKYYTFDENRKISVVDVDEPLEDED